MKYNCPRCGYEAERLDHYNKHLKRKQICLPILKDISLDEEKEKYLSKREAIYKCEFCDRKFTTRSAIAQHNVHCNYKKYVLLKEVEKLKQHLDKLIPDENGASTSQQINEFTKDIMEEITQDITETNKEEITQNITNQTEITQDITETTKNEITQDITDEEEIKQDIKETTNDELTQDITETIEDIAKNILEKIINEITRYTTDDVTANK